MSKQLPKDQSWANDNPFLVKHFWKINLEMSDTCTNIPHVIEHLDHTADGSFASVVIALRVFVGVTLLVERVVGQVHEGLM